MPNSLMGEAGLKIGPLVLETLVKHYFDRLKHHTEDGRCKGMTKLRHDEMLYDQAFSIAKAFLEASSHHTIEELQGFSNTRTPSPPWVRVMRVIIPMSCCDEASVCLVKALGGEDVARRVMGGTKWWQVRGLGGVDAQWITAKKDWREHKRQYKEQLRGTPQRTPPPSTDALNGSEDSGEYQKEMDEMRCILYAHGGGYYFGSVDQERYAIQRYARKINGRVFAVNYRLAPQYPAPCGIQDMVAAYLYLIKPPPGASHCPVKPAHIIVSGDSAGGGLTLALLQAIRDSGLPMPAGGVLVSPWCDMTHSFPSIHTNTATDVIPYHGLSMHKPSTLWPPPPEEISHRVHATLRSRLRQALRLDHSAPEPHSPTSELPSHVQHLKSGSISSPMDVGTTTPLPRIDSLRKQTISLVAESGETLVIDHQVQFYAQNSLLAHPYISPAVGYLGGLCPLLFIASDKEVLRDEIIYTAHKAAYPERFPIKDETREIYPALVGIESRYKRTPVHLQVYDDAAHVLPVLFPFTTPAKFCYRAIATFCKQVTGIPMPQTSYNGSSTPSLMKPPKPKRSVSVDPIGDQTLKKKKSLRRSVSANLARAFGGRNSSSSSFKSDSGTEGAPPVPPLPTMASLSPLERTESPASFPTTPTSAPIMPRTPREDSDVAGPRFKVTPPTPKMGGPRCAGDPIVYRDTSESSFWHRGMIRERVSTQGLIRPLEPEADLVALCIPHHAIGVLSELSVRRYLDGRNKFDKKYAGTIKTIEKHRNKNLERSKKDFVRNIAQLQNHLVAKDERGDVGNEPEKGIKEGLLAASGSWTWAWALDGQEKPPPSSIVSRRDTSEARRLAKIADQSEEASMSANRLWSIMVNYLSTTPYHQESANKAGSSPRPTDGGETEGPPKQKSRFPKFIQVSRGGSNTSSSPDS